MSVIDTGTLKSLGSGGCGPWLMGGGKMLRIASGNHVIRSESEARAMLERYREAAAVAGTPTGHEVVALDGGYGVVVDYVAGVGLGLHLVVGSYTPHEAGQAMGELLRGLHGARMGVGRDWNATFREWAADLAPLLPTDAGDRIVALVAAIPESRCLLHGDFHVGNVVVGAGELRLIDMESAGFGHPAFDLAIARSRMLGNAVREAGRLEVDLETAERIADGIWKGLLEGYFADLGADERGDIDRRIEVLCELERCSFAYGVGRPGPNGADERQRARVERCAERMAQLLPGIVSLDF